MCPRFVNHSIASDKVDLQRISPPIRFPIKNANAHCGLSESKKMSVPQRDDILVVDDDRASRRMLLQALRNAGYTCRNPAAESKRSKACPNIRRRFSCSISTCQS